MQKVSESTARVTERPLAFRGRAAFPDDAPQPFEPPQPAGQQDEYAFSPGTSPRGEPDSDETEPSIGATEALGDHGSLPEQPRTSGGVLFSLGLQWTVADDEMRIKAAYEQWVRAGALAAAYDARQRGDPASAEQLYRTYNADFGMRLYNWDSGGGGYVAKALQTATGLRYLLFLLLRRCHPNVTERIVEAMWNENQDECQRVVGWALGNLPSLVGMTKIGDLTQEEIAAAHRTRKSR
ncbi:MAG: hypothetical protein KGL39_25620 [Patescibacteria group bacterium]|nr:hypothetical protein [Patescibacteria group bacterium]